jgi:hypothetical protein
MQYRNRFANTNLSSLKVENSKIKSTNAGMGFQTDVRLLLGCEASDAKTYVVMHVRDGNNPFLILAPTPMF